MLRCPRCARRFDHERAGEGAGCDACGTELVPEEPAPPIARASYTELVLVYRPRDLSDLTLVRAMLTGADIPVYACGEEVALGDAAGAAFPRMLLVPVDFARRAREVLREQRVLRPAEGDGEDLAGLFSDEVVPLLAGPRTRRLRAELAVRPEAFRIAFLGAIGAAGPRGVELVAELALSFAAEGPRAAAREAADFLAAAEEFREQRAGLALALGALAIGADRDRAARVIAALERLRGIPAAERALVPLLDHEDAALRDAAIEALFSVSGGETLGYEPDAEAGARRAAVARWWERVGGAPGERAG